MSSGNYWARTVTTSGEESEEAAGKVGGGVTSGEFWAQNESVYESAGSAGSDFSGCESGEGGSFGGGLVKRKKGRLTGPQRLLRERLEREKLGKKDKTLQDWWANHEEKEGGESR